MCRIPVFCWITATVLEYLLTVQQKRELPNTVTDLYSHFVVVQTQRQEQKSDKCHGKRHQRITMDDRYVLLKLGKLAFEHLEEGNIMFYQEDLEQCGLEMPEDSFNSGVCNRIFKRERVLFWKPVYSFVHRSLQEFLAAVYARQCYNNKCTPVLHGFLKDVDEDSLYHLSLDVYLNKVVEKALHSKNGHLDLFVRFLHGLSLESNQRLLKGLLDRTENSPAIVWKIMKNLKKMNIGDTSPDRSINIFHCLVEMNDVTVDKEIQEFLKSRSRSQKKLSEIHCSALAYKLLASEQVLDELDLSKYTMSIKGRQRLIPAVKNCRKARLTGCELSIIHCNIVALALSSAPSSLRELDLSRNLVENAGLKQLFDALGSSNCKLESLRLEACNIGPVGCKYLVSALESNPSHLTELDLSENKLRDTGVKSLCGFLASPHCRLRTLSLRKCCLSEISCNALAPVLKSNLIRLRHLDLSENKLEDVGVRKLYGCLEGASGLETLKLSQCGATHESCYTLAAALKSHNSHLLHLDLSHNKLKDLGLKHMCTGLKSPHCRLETLRLRSCGLSGGSSLVPVLNSKLSRLRTLDLTDNKIEEEEVIQLRGFETDSHYALRSLRISKADGSLTELPEEMAVGKDLGDFSDEPGPSGSRFNDGVKQPTSFTNLEYLGLPSGFLNIWDSDLDGGWPTDRDQQDTTCADEPAKLKHLQLESPKVLTDASKLKIVAGKASYRLWCPGRGSFSCTRTGLVFVVSREAEVVYSTVQWDEGLLDSTGKMAAGPLFDINCSEDAVCELHLPHCDTKEDVLSGNWLSVAHISETGTSFIKPLEVTDTHVVVKTPHLSRFGNVWNDISTFWTRKILSQVLLFLRPPNLEQKKQKLNVFLLPSNIPLDEVRAQQQGFNYIQAPSNSKLIKDQSYTLHCPQAFKIQPKKADFVIEFGPNYHPTFEIRLPSDSEEATLSVKHHMQEVWEYEACLTDFLPSTEEGSEESLERKLKDVLPEFVQSVTEPIANQLLDRLFKEGVIGNEERESAGKETSAQRARSLIEMVLKKGKEAILILLNALKEKDRVLYKKLKL